MRLKLIPIFLFFGQFIAAQKPVILSDFVQEVSISDMQLQFLEDPNCSTMPSELFTGMLDQEFKVVDFSDPDPALVNCITGSCMAESWQ